ncbi:hypothetical protein EV426DRAFT_577075 [Tirmania nivea]|nr:hypothetical protein EV426DRAFT_577075 [Tirmania nivea]
MAAAIVIIASPLMASAFPVPNVANWLAGHNLETTPAVAAEIDQFPKFVPRTYEVPRNCTNSTDGNAPEYGYGYSRKMHRGLTPLPRSVDVLESKPGPKVQDVKPPKVDFDPAVGANQKRGHN